MSCTHEKLSAIPGLREAVAKYGVERLARLLSESGEKIKKQSFYRWERVPAERCIAIHKLTGVPLHQIRPDVYPAPDTANACDCTS